MTPVPPKSIQPHARSVGHALWSEVVALELRLLVLDRILEHYRSMAPLAVPPVELATLAPPGALIPQPDAPRRSDEWLNAYT